MWLSIRMIERGKDRNGKPIGAVLGGVEIVPEPFLPVTIAAPRAESWQYMVRDRTHAHYARADAVELTTVTFAVEPETKRDDGQHPFLDAIGRVRAEAIMNGQPVSYRAAMEQAATQYPVEFRLYCMRPAGNDATTDSGRRAGALRLLHVALALAPAN